jgi:uncharacterized protein YbjT (DUF2867 family)/nitrite reductase/ring-hydroxylating ferredoxin subunit
VKIAVIGGTGLVGSKLIARLREQGHEAASAMPGEGVAEVLSGAAVVVDVADPPVDLLEHEAAAGVTHHVALATVGSECLAETSIAASGIPYSILRSTQLFESLGAIADAETNGVHVRVPPLLVQPIAADDVVRVMAEIAVGEPVNGTIEMGGPEPFYLDGLLERILGARKDPRTVIVDPHARYCGADGVGTGGSTRSLMASEEALLGTIRFDDWLGEAAPPCPPAQTMGRRAYEFCVSDLLPGSVLLLGDVAVFSAGGGLCATQALCTHRAGPLSEGAIDDTTVTCPLHGAQFNIWTGAVLRGPAKDSLKTYRVIIDGDIGRVDVPQPEDQS